MTVTLRVSEGDRLAEEDAEWCVSLGEHDISCVDVAVIDSKVIVSAAVTVGLAESLVILMVRVSVFVRECPTEDVGVAEW